MYRTRQQYNDMLKAAQPIEALYYLSESRELFAKCDIVVGLDIEFPRSHANCVLFDGRAWCQDNSWDDPSPCNGTAWICTLSFSHLRRDIEALCSACWALRGNCDFDRSQSLFRNCRKRIVPPTAVIFGSQSINLNIRI